MKGTRLWQAPGSPIIQGRSRTARPFWEAWLLGAVVAEAVAIAAGFALGFQGAGHTLGTGASTISLANYLPGVPGSVLGAAIGVLLARTMGWRRQWVAGAAVGVLLAGISLAFV